MTRAEQMEQLRQARERMQAILDLCEAEHRARTAEETKEFDTLRAKTAAIQEQFNNETNPPIPMETTNPRRIALDADMQLRNAAASQSNVRFVFKRAIMDTTGVTDTGLIPVLEQEFIKPLHENLIYTKIGLRLRNGLKGKLRWPIHSVANAATWEGETTKLEDSAITFSKLEMSGKRVGIAIPVSNEELTETSGVVESIIYEEAPLAIADKINKALLSLYAEGEDKAALPVVGPWAQSANNPSQNCALKVFGANISRKDLLDMKAAVAGAGIKFVAPVWIMNDVMKSNWEDTKVDAGSGRFVCEQDRILGYPVITSSDMPNGVVYFGDLSYQAAGFFGENKMLVDPYTLARNNSTDFVVNAKFGMARLRKEAFIVGMTTSAKTAHDAAITARTASQG